MRGSEPGGGMEGGAIWLNGFMDWMGLDDGADGYTFYFHSL